MPELAVLSEYVCPELAEISPKLVAWKDTATVPPMPTVNASTFVKYSSVSSSTTVIVPAFFETLGVPVMVNGIRVLRGSYHFILFKAQIKSSQIPSAWSGSSCIAI